MPQHLIHHHAAVGLINPILQALENQPHLLFEPDEKGQTILLFAAAEGHADLVKHLLARGAAVDLATFDPDSALHNKTALYSAIEHDQVDMEISSILDCLVNLKISILRLMLIKRFKNNIYPSI